MGQKLLEEIYNVKQFDINKLENPVSIGRITDRDRFLAAKQILFGLALLYVLTIIAYLFRPNEGDKLLYICTTTFPPLATLILVFYFKDKAH